MYFWNIDKLKQDIEEKKLDEGDRFTYAFIYIVLSALFFEAYMFFPSENLNAWDFLNSFCSIGIVVFGTYFAYKANGGNNGTDFLGRFFSINFVIAIRFMTLLIPMFLFLLVYYIYLLPEDHDLSSTSLDTIPVIIWYAFIYIRTCKHIRDVKNS